MDPSTTKRWRGIALRRPAALDLFCCAGGAGHGLVEGGFRTVVGVDREDHHKAAYEHRPEMKFVCADVSTLTADDLRHFDLIWGSPPCQFATGIIPRAMREKHEARWKAQGKHINMIPTTRALMNASGRPYIIENVVGAKSEFDLDRTIKLCGTHFGLSTFRHRLFESNVPLESPGPCSHRGCSTGGLMKSIPQPKVERFVDDDDDEMLPAGIEKVVVDYPCRKGERPDHIYRATSPEMEALLRKTFKRRYARSVKELFRATGRIVPMSDAEKRQEVHRFESAQRRELPRDTKLMFPIFGTNKSRGTNEQWRESLQTPWIASRDELREAIPPAYSSFLAEQVLRKCRRRGVVM